LSIVYVPLSLFPAPGFCTLGIAGDLPGDKLQTALPFPLFVFSLGACGASFVSALYYRYRLLSNKSMGIFKSKRMIGGMFVFHLFNGGIILFSYYFLVYGDWDEYGTWWNYINIEYHQVIPIVNQLLTKCGGIIIENHKTKILFAVILVEFGVYFLIATLAPWYIYRCLKSQVKTLSKKMYSLQKQLVVSLAFQVIKNLQSSVHLDKSCYFLLKGGGVRIRDSGSENGAAGASGGPTRG
jgi:hypothetical protein